MDEQPFSVKKVHDGVFMLREVFFEALNQANIWLVQGSSSDLVIDTGIGLWDLQGFLRQQGLIGEKPVQAVATHMHYDHSGGLHQFEKFSIHYLEADAIRNGNQYDMARFFLRNADIAVPPSEGWKFSDYRVKAAEPSTVLEEGHVFDLGNRSLRVLHFPGHTAGSIGLIDEKARILFSGDTVYESNPLIDFLPTSDVNSFVQSCRRLQNLSNHVDVVFPGHGDSFDSRRLHELASDYISNAGPCHKFFTTFMKGVIYVILKAKTSGDIPANCCFHSCCCCCCFK